MESSAIPVEELQTSQIFISPSDLADRLGLEDAEHVVDFGYDGDRYVFEVAKSDESGMR